MDLYYKLEQNISSSIYEGLLKLGYSSNEDFSIYYDLDLLNHLLDSEFKSREECYPILRDFKKYMTEQSKYLSIFIEKGRFKFTVTKDGIDTIYKEYEKNHFLKDLIHLVNSRAFTLEDVKNVFKCYDLEFICEESKNPEFQYVLYFKDNTIDPYRYCFSFDAMGGYYHRLLEYDYNKTLDD